MKPGKIVACIALFQLLCGWGTVQSSSLAARPKPGKIMGVVLDKYDARVVHAAIKVEGPGFKWSGETDDAGDFAVKVPAGTYRIYVSAPGFRSFESSFLTVKSGVVEMVNLHLEVAAAQSLVPAENQKKP